MYRWRKMSDDERALELKRRQASHRPLHSPAHYQTETKVYLVSAACYEHHPHIGWSELRLDDFSGALQSQVGACCERIDGWVVLPNRYHVLVCGGEILDLLKALGRLHGKTAHAWNGEENSRGRKVWFNALERPIRTDRHHHASIQYIHHNPVKHGYARKWTDWKWSSAAEYLASVGREEAERRWLEYPVHEFGKGWDD